MASSRVTPAMREAAAARAAREREAATQEARYNTRNWLNLNFIKLVLKKL